MKKIYYPAAERGYFDHGWLKTYHSFSFASWYSPSKVNFGRLRVLNDDTVLPNMGFGIHPHDNMEIITIPMKGSLAHKDSMNNQQVISPNEVQVMSAGTGLLHSEFNASDTENVEFFQIWIFPDKSGYTPRYEQKYFDPIERKNNFQTIVAPAKNSGSLWLNQDAHLFLGDFEKSRNTTYKIHNSKNGIYIFVIDGKINVAEEILNKRDAVGIWDIDDTEISIIDDSKILLIEIPMD